ncbi:Leucyl aminopeptidase [Thermobaculum terrenum ATCC BAA-798]|uniref:Probable cytosol aminopeptidase n=1 Tax=Thermobaculum terrenum (strain ATCC BAA-798 / CCMEE 7001 / YNP1) TaxID=525904 RepID=D1CBV6_THET1|nr:leucyl aminopeptidase [Thermobaculum terrenum]ACZ42271.1 Leucyl aminopeptidase [Thermobaculum terrenum ATCC BAA-798]
MKITYRVGGLLESESRYIAVPMFAGQDMPYMNQIDSNTPSTDLVDVASQKEQVSLINTGQQDKFILLIGMGELSNTLEAIRKFSGAAVRWARKRKIDNLSIFLPSLSNPNNALVAAAVHGAIVGNFSPETYKTSSQEINVESTEFILESSGSDISDMEATINRATAIGESVNLARTLANEPPNVLTTREFARRAQSLCEVNGLTCEILEEEDLRQRGYSAILAVASGSSEPARMVIIKYEASDSPYTIGFVGKGITFDTGGISLKPAENMHRMKSDMSGAAAVLGAMIAISKIKPKVNVVGVLCLAENMPSGSAMRPGDVIKAGSGKTIEVLNTDAEGRLVLADGIVQAKKEGATHLVDVATLTGACVVALGTITTGVFGSHQYWTDIVLNAASQVGEKMWQMPTFAEYREQLDSDIADIANSGGREAGAITGALFIKEFAEDTPWVHLDIAGTAWNNKDLPHIAKGPTGVATATLTKIADIVASRGIDSNG